MALVRKPKARSAKPATRSAKPAARSAKPATRSAKPSGRKPKQTAGFASKARRAANAETTFAALRAAHPDAHCELHHRSAFELTVATVLSAQSTDVAVNRVTPALFDRWPTAEAMAEAEPAELEQALNRLGMFRQKAKNIIGLSRLLCTRHGGEVPKTLPELVALPGVGRKTANVVLGVAFGAPEGVVVDTHVQRISQRLGWTAHQTPDKIETDLMALFPREHWDLLSHTLIFHGRRICSARNPACAACPVSGLCPSAFDAERVGRKPPRVRGAEVGATTTSRKKPASPSKRARKAGGREPPARRAR